MANMSELSGKRLEDYENEKLKLSTDFTARVTQTKASLEKGANRES